MPEVSVIIPNYNHALYLDQRINSVLNQRFKDFELIILDDCSTDASQSIINQYKEHPQVSAVVFNEANSGSTFKQWQKGINIAKGKWVWIAESDDWCEPTFLEEMIVLTNGNPGAVLSYCQSIVFSCNQILYKTSLDLLSEHYIGRDWVARNMLGNCLLLNASMAIFKRNESISIIESLPDFKQCGDWFFWCALAKKGDVCVSGKYLNYFRKHTVNVTESNWSKGYFFTEGSLIFSKQKSDLNLTKFEIKNGLDKFFTHLQNNRSIFSAEKYQELQNHIANIEPSVAKELLMKYERNSRKKKFINTLKKSLKFVFNKFRNVFSF